MTVNGWSIRPAQAADADVVAAVHVRAWRESYRDIVPAKTLARLALDRRVAHWQATLDPSSRTSVFVALDDRRRVGGFVSAGPRQAGGPPPPGEIHAIYLLDRMKGQGIGRRLFQAGLDALRRDGFATAGLWVFEANWRARGFYDRMGGKTGPVHQFRLDGALVTEVAYVWPDLQGLAAGET